MSHHQTYYLPTVKILATGLHACVYAVGPVVGVNVVVTADGKSEEASIAAEGDGHSWPTLSSSLCGADRQTSDSTKHRGVWWSERQQRETGLRVHW